MRVFFVTHNCRSDYPMGFCRYQNSIHDELSRITSNMNESNVPFEGILWLLMKLGLPD